MEANEEKLCTECSIVKPRRAFSKRQWARSGKCSACANPAAADIQPKRRHNALATAEQEAQPRARGDSAAAQPPPCFQPDAPPGRPVKRVRAGEGNHSDAPIEPDLAQSDEDLEDPLAEAVQALDPLDMEADDAAAARDEMAFLTGQRGGLGADLTASDMDADSASAILQHEVARILECGDSTTLRVAQKLRQLRHAAEKYIHSDISETDAGGLALSAATLPAESSAGSIQPRRCTLCHEKLDGGKPTSVWPSKHVCVPSEPIMPKRGMGPHVQCAACAAVCTAVWCCQEHMDADAWRHRDECKTMRQHAIKKYLKAGRTSMRRAYEHRGEEYTFGLTDNPAHRVQCRRTVLGRTVKDKRCASASVGYERSFVAEYTDRLRMGCELALETQEVGALAVAKRLTRLPSDHECFAPCKPWVSYCSPTSIVLNWTPAVDAGRFGLTPYVIQSRFVAQIGTESSAPTLWSDLDAESGHRGLNPSHIVRGLTVGQKYQFRVGVRSESKSAKEKSLFRWSPPSDPITVGFANVSIVEELGETSRGAHGFTAAEMVFFATLDTPGKVQGLLDAMPLNHEAEVDTCLSALEAVRQNHAHCIEAAMLGAYVLSLHGHRPMLLDMRASSSDDDHIVTPYCIEGRWGCLSKTNHAAIRFRNPVYKTLRELLMSYFDEYLSKDGTRELRSYSYPVHLDAVFGPEWPFIRGDVGHIAGFMDAIPHYRLCDRKHLSQLRPADPFMMASQVTQREWPQPENYSEAALLRNANK
eukprot:m.468580 g.468580  ORF g.468580 m.468580 type:complete len:758 (-) comp27577_c0_seq1:70-2343(-)